ncbi:imidazolonepropionase [bacterium]|nr:imidazolonepropionase [bacterium]
MSTLLVNISKLCGITEESVSPKVGADMAKVECIEDAFLLIEDGLIADFGPIDEAPEEADDYIDCKYRMVVPAYVDSHTHLVFAKPRSDEFRMRLEGKSYQEIAAAGGGIINSAMALREKSDEDLLVDVMGYMEKLRDQGTAVFEIKSGYGLDLESEIKMLRVINVLEQVTGLPVIPTFLGAHAVPPEFKDNKSGYVDHVINDMLPVVTEEGLADYIDLFCEEGYFDLEDMRRILEAAAEYGMQGKVHVNQFSSMGSVKLACELGALSVDHLEVMEEEDFKALENGKTLAVGLPLCSLFLNIPYAPGREIIDRGIPFVLASDFNPGSSPSGNLSLAFALACTQMKLRPEEAFNALTYNAAFALQLNEQVGSIQKGKIAHLNILKTEFQDLADIAYWFGNDPIDEVV